ncbi:flagellar hook assembly protein FlgD [Rhizobacter sp. J219]|jgi:flagellar basal-body rod modification protein FlgD|uniref:flagellar hook assembly protein FlgD n=1 Tax=Rhizobacter sp. J219 TaxID=2898430 RepID=UPI00215086A7|nr:flagellar hook capping FlgD N-terminal domain-containing protein [Rhizobacter sp. J219]MCR5883263.1 flagellar hook assembly protein FlgD [Rhizobacter sp. J219]
MAVSNVQSAYDKLNAKSGVQTANEAGAADRFLKLLVAQMQNQDPLSPMDNAQVTSQMAQIQSVTGIENLNKTVQGLSGQFVQMQALQGASLIGREVIVPGNKIVIANGVGEGGFELNSAADSVKVEVLGPSGHVLDTLNLGAQAAGAHNFSWNAGSNATATGVTFRVTAMSGSTKLDSTPLMHDTVSAINTSGDSLTLELKNSGNVAYSQVKAFN